MIILKTDITDSLWTKIVSETDSDAYFALGTSQWEMLCTEYGIDESKIATPTPYLPTRIATICCLLQVCKDLIGSDWREVREGVTVDVYQMKLNTLTDELNELLSKFTPKMCGYDDDTDTTNNNNVFLTMQLVRG